jgi:predicted transcriptional regulator of viral defense system
VASATSLSDSDQAGSLAFPNSKNDRKIIIAEKEEAIVVCVDLPKYCDDITEAAKGLWNGRNEFDSDKLISYAHRTENGAIVKWLGYLMDALDIKKANVRRELAKHLTTGYVPLNPGGDKNGRYSSNGKCS